MRTEENRKNTDKNRKIILGTVCGVMLITTAVAAAKIKVVVSEKNDLASRTNVGLIANELTTEPATTSVSTTTETTTNANLDYSYVSESGNPSDTVSGHMVDGQRYESVEILPTDSPTDGFIYNNKYIVLNMSMNDVFSRFGKGMTLYQIEKAAAENTTKTEVETVSGEENTEAVSEDSIEITTHDVRHLANITMTDDNSYEYNGFTVISYKKDGAEYVKSVIVTDPKIKSPTGLSFIGNPIFDVTGRYGAPSSVDGNLYIYNVTNSTYMFFICPEGNIEAWGVASK